MIRLTKNAVKLRLDALNASLGLPADLFSSQVSEPTKFAIGHICLTHSSYGYTIEQVVSDNGAVSLIGSGLSLKDAYNIIRGMEHGVSLSKEKNEHT